MKVNRPAYINWFTKNTTPVIISTGEIVVVYSINHIVDDIILDEWAKHLLYQYCDNTTITSEALACGKTVENYIKEDVLPNRPMNLSGNFAEMLFSDFVEFVLGYNVSRYKYFELSTPNSSPNGIDLIALKFDNNNHVNDVALFMEIKARLKETNFNKLQEAINDITKRDDKDFALALNAAKRKLKARGENQEALQFERFQNPAENPFKKILAAGAITQSIHCSSTDCIGISVPDGSNIKLHIIHADDLWNLAKDLYRRACL